MERHKEIMRAWNEISCYGDDSELARHAFFEGAMWADDNPHWISVQERKPFIGSAVMVAMEGCIEVETGFYGTDKIFRDSEGNKLEGVTHFIPFPRLPEGGEE